MPLIVFENRESKNTENEMKSEHRHELKTNELAEWLGNLPQWTKDNLKTIICVSILIVVVGAFYIWKVYNKNVLQVRERTEFTNLLDQVSASKMQVLQAQAQGTDLSYMLLQPANSLEIFAQKTKNDQMAALALIKRAEALRAELHYGTVEEPYLITQTNLAKNSYTKALERCPDNPLLSATAKFGLGLCAEELGGFEQAQQIYNEITENPDFQGTVAVAQAKLRLETMDDYKKKLVFKPAPIPPAIPLLPGGTTPGASQPMIQIMPSDTILPTEVNLPVETNLPVDVNLIPLTPDNPVDTAPNDAIPQVPDANLPPPAKPDNQIDGPNSISKDSEDSR